MNAREIIASANRRIQQLENELADERSKLDAVKRENEVLKKIHGEKQSNVESVRWTTIR